MSDSGMEDKSAGVSLTASPPGLETAFFFHGFRHSLDNMTQLCLESNGGIDVPPAEIFQHSPPTAENFGLYSESRETEFIQHYSDSINFESYDI